MLFPRQDSRQLAPIRANQPRLSSDQPRPFLLHANPSGMPSSEMPSICTCLSVWHLLVANLRHVLEIWRLNILHACLGDTSPLPRRHLSPPYASLTLPFNLSIITSMPVPSERHILGKRQPQRQRGIQNHAGHGTLTSSFLARY